MYTVWRHNLCLSFGKISPRAVAAGRVLYLHVLSPQQGGAQCLSVIKVFVRNAQTVFTSCGTKWAGRCPTSVTLRFWNYCGNDGWALVCAYLRMCTACWTQLELKTCKEPLEEQHGTGLCSLCPWYWFSNCERYGWVVGSFESLWRVIYRLYIVSLMLDFRYWFKFLAFIFYLSSFYSEWRGRKTNDNKNLESMWSMFVSAPLMSSSEGGPTQEMI